jgi:cytochrome c2
MKIFPVPSAAKIPLLLLCLAPLLAFASACSQGEAAQSTPAASGKMAAGSDGPSHPGTPVPRQDGDANAGRDVFRFETFGNEGFWTDAVRLPAGIKAAHVTPLKALQLGLQVDSDAIDPATLRELKAQLQADPTGRGSALLNDPAMTEKLVKANAMIGMPAKGARVGTSCALCHTMTDASVLKVPEGGSIGRRLDGLANHDLNLGMIFATAANSRALYPVLQLNLAANHGKTLGRAPTGLTETSTEAEVDAYLSNPKFYPVGMFDDTFDGNGDPMHNTPLFRQDLAAPFGSEGTIARLDNFSNLVFTSLFDQTNLTTPGGRAFLHKLAGPAGDELADDYVKVLAATGVKGYPFVKAAPHPKPGSEDAPIGVRVDNAKLLALNAYLARLQAPRGAKVDAQMASQGRQMFRTVGCTGCHNVDQGKRVPAMVVPMKKIFPGDNPVTLAQRTPPLNPIMNTEDSVFDDKMAVLNASLRGDMRGIALPLLLDLARKPVFLHDNSVSSLDDLFDPKRGGKAPHPFYLSDARQRAEMVAFLRSLDTSSK